MIAFAELSWSKLRSSASLTKSQHQWPDPEQSTGTHFCRMGKFECWAAIGRAGQMYKELSRDIRKLLEERVEYINEGEPVVKMITFRLYMTGRRKSCARPTVMICCERAIPRRRARELIRESAILEKYPGVILGESSHPPDFDRPPIQLALDYLGIDAHENPTGALATVFWRFSRSLCGQEIFIGGNGGGDPQRKATIGGILKSGDRYFALTVAHAFVAGPLELAEAVDLEFDIDEQSNSETEDEDFIEVTSGGSATPDSARVSHLFAPNSIAGGSPLVHRNTRSRSYFNEDNDTTAPLDVQMDSDMLQQVPGTPAVVRDDEIEGALQVLGLLVMSSTNGLNPSLDWGLVEITWPGLRMFNEIPHSAESITSFIYPEKFVTSGPKGARVLAATSSGGVLSGILSETPTFMNFPNSRVFQEVWTVSLNGKLIKDDCGSWVVDAKSGDVYGHIIAGSPEAGIAYVVPGYQILEDIKKQFSSGIEISTRAKMSQDEGKTAQPPQKEPQIAPEGKALPTTQIILSQIITESVDQQDMEQQHDAISPIAGEVPAIALQVEEDVISKEIIEPDNETSVGLKPETQKPWSYRSTLSGGLLSRPSDKSIQQLPLGDYRDVELGLLDDSTTPFNRSDRMKSIKSAGPLARKGVSRSTHSRMSYISPALRVLPIPSSLIRKFGKRHVPEDPSSLSQSNRVSREIFFKVLLGSDEITLPNDVAYSLSESSMAWYAKFLESKFKSSWTAITRDALRGLSNHPNEPQPDDISIIYRCIGVVAQMLLEVDRGLSMVDIVDELSNQGLLKDQREWDRTIPNQFVFLVVGWLTMLYDPPPAQTPGALEVRRSTGSINRRRNRYRSGHTFSRYKLVGFDTFDQSIALFLRGFGRVVPEPSRSDTTDLIFASSLSFSTLSRIGNIRIEWVDSLGLHLEFDNSRRILKIFRFPSYCLLMCREANLLSKLYNENRRVSEWREEKDWDPMPEFFREVLLTYRLLFGQDRASWKLMQKELLKLRESWDCSGLENDDRDPMLRTLCCSSYDSPDVRRVYEEIKESDNVSPCYIPDSEFPFLGRRLLSLQASASAYKVQDLKALWHDRRNVPQWWSFWSVLFIGGAIVLLELLQTGFQIWNSVVSQRQLGSLTASPPR